MFISGRGPLETRRGLLTRPCLERRRSGATLCRSATRERRPATSFSRRDVNLSMSVMIDFQGLD
jgi:hypothetical protein